MAELRCIKVGAGLYRLKTNFALKRQTPAQRPKLHADHPNNWRRDPRSPSERMPLCNYFLPACDGVRAFVLMDLAGHY